MRRRTTRKHPADQLYIGVRAWFLEIIRTDCPQVQSWQVLFFTLNREDFSFVIHLDRQPRTSRRREAQTGSRARSGSRSERTLDAVEHSRTLMEWWPFLIFHRGGLRIKVINNSRSKLRNQRRIEFLRSTPRPYRVETSSIWPSNPAPSPRTSME